MKAKHLFMRTQSDRGILRSFGMMQGFGVKPFTLENARGERSFAKFHFTPTLGVHSFSWEKALEMTGRIPDFHRIDLYEVISKGVFPT